jgi:DNA repair protein RecN (Recombination protein N)
MLSELHIENVGVIERLDLVLGAGLTVLTGETGAGKTMLIEAISLLIGGRADASVVRRGADEARVEGRFVIDDEEFVVARVVPADGRSRAYINGRLATVAGLADLAARAVDLHGQHDHQSLLSPSVQRAALDRFCGTDLEPLRAARATLTEIDAALAALGGDGRARARELDLLRFQAGELDLAAIASPTEDDDLNVELDVLSGAAAYRETGEHALGLLVDDGGALDIIGQAAALLGRAAPFATHNARLVALVAELGDTADELRAAAEGIDEDPQRLHDVRQRLALLRDLRKKYGETLGDVIAFADEVRARLSELESFEARAATLDDERLAAVDIERAAARRVAAQRRSGADDLAARIETRLRTLAMPHAVVAVAVGGEAPSDDVAVMLAANPGSLPAPVQRVASGGELARTMLALRLVLSEAPDTLLFDEVDAGIGGQAAVSVAEALDDLAERHQVLVVTHLAQVAAAADHHVVVAKEVRDGATFATVRHVAGNDRVAEVARMLSGSLAGDAALTHAAELLQSFAHVGG